MSAARDLQATLQARAKALPLATPKSLRESCEDRAALAFPRGLEASGMSNRQFATRIGHCERVVRDYIAGFRAVPTWVLLELPEAGQIAAFRILVDPGAT